LNWFRFRLRQKDLVNEEFAMIAKHTTKPAKALKAKKPRTKNWQEAIRLHLAKVPEVDAVFVNREKQAVHVYSIVHEFSDGYPLLSKKEKLIEKAFPKISFEFHTRAHQGREPHYAAPWDAELVFSR
jgi:hypothetical protein